MFTKSEKSAEKVRFFSSVFGKVYADEGAGESPEPSINFEELISKARHEVKNQLYPQIEKLKETNKTLTDSINEKLIENAKLSKKLEEMKKSNESNSEVTALKTQLEEAKTAYETLKQSTPVEEEIREKVRSEYEVKFYREQKLREHEKDILPVLTKTVMGETKEEIDASIEAAKAETFETKKQLGLVNEDGTPIIPTAPHAPKPPTVNPATISVGNNLKYSVEQLKNMSPSEYAKFREESKMFKR